MSNPQRSGDDFKKTVDQEKIAAFGKVLQKFFDNEREDYKKEEAQRAPDYQALQKRAGQVGMGENEAGIWTAEVGPFFLLVYWLLVHFFLVA